MRLRLVGEGVQRGLGLCLRREDALDGGQREGAIASSTRQSGDEVLYCVSCQKSEQSIGLILSVAASADELFEEGRTVGTELGESSGEKLLTSFVVTAWLMLGLRELLVRARRLKLVAGDLVKFGRVDDELFVGDPYWKGLSDA